MRPPTFIYRNVSMVGIVLAGLFPFAMFSLIDHDSWAFVIVPLAFLFSGYMLAFIIKYRAKRFVTWREEIKSWADENYGVQLNGKDLLRLSTPMIQLQFPIFVDRVHFGSPNLILYFKNSKYYYVSYTTPVRDGTRRVYVLTIEPDGEAKLEYLTKIFGNKTHDLVPFKDPYRAN